MINEEKEKKNKRLYGHFPMFLLPAIMELAFKKHLKNSPETQRAIKELMKQIKGSMTNEYFVHMDTLLGDLRNSFGTHHKEDFAYLKGRVLIIEPDDDKTFTDDIKESLINIMTEPKVVRDLKGVPSYSMNADLSESIFPESQTGILKSVALSDTLI